MILGITLHRPWPWAILYGGKRVENRTWAPHADLRGGYLALHAGLSWDQEAASAMRDGEFGPGGIGCPMSEQFHKKGHIVGLARLTGWREVEPLELGRKERDRWAFGPIAWTLDCVVPFPKPVRCRGAQKLWKVPDELRPALEEQWRAGLRAVRDHYETKARQDRSNL